MESGSGKSRFCYKDGTCPDFYRVRCITDGRAGHDDKDAPEGTSMRLTVKNGSAPISKEEEAMKEYLSSIQDVLNEKKTSEEGLSSQERPAAWKNSVTTS